MPKTIAAIIKWALYFIAGNFGYSQLNRWTGLKNGKPNEPGDFDCTSIIGAILYLAGYIPLMLLMGTWYSGNIADVLEAQGWKRVSAKGKSLAWLNANVTAGCVLVGPHHGVLGLGDGMILSWEYSEHHTAAGTVGRQKGEIVGKRKLYLRSRGWDDLLIPPADAGTVAQTTPLALEAAQASLDAGHFGGPEDYLSIGKELGKLGSSLIGCTETTVTRKGKTAWSGRAKIQQGLGAGWTRAAFLALCIFWPSAKYSKAGKRRTVQFGTSGDIWHGAMLVPLLRKDSTTRIDVEEVHVRSRGAFAKSASDAAVLSGKRGDVRKALKLVDKNVPTIIFGDTAGDRDDIFTEFGFTRVSPKVDTYDPAGEQHDDGVWFSHHLLGSGGRRINPGIWSDHKWLAVHVSKAPTTV